MLWLGLFMAGTGGCCFWEKPAPTAPLGAISDPIWNTQLTEAKASDFVMYQHEFEYNDIRLNQGGEDHIKAIAARLNAGACMPVVVERSMTSPRPDSEYRYPVNANAELDMRRREAVVGSLIAMGVANADRIVVVAPPLAEGYTAVQAVRSYNRGLTNSAPGYGGAGAGTSGAIGSAGFPTITMP